MIKTKFYSNDIDRLFHKIVFEEDLEYTLNKLKQPMKSILKKRESFSDPLFALKLKKFNEFKKENNGHGAKRKYKLERMLKNIDKNYEVI